MPIKSIRPEGGYYEHPLRCSGAPIKPSSDSDRDVGITVAANFRDEGGKPSFPDRINFCRIYDQGYCGSAKSTSEPCGLINTYPITELPGVRRLRPPLT